MNSKTVIRKRGQQQVAVRKEDNPNAVITCKTYFARYWVSLSYAFCSTHSDLLFFFRFFSISIKV